MESKATTYEDAAVATVTQGLDADLELRVSDILEALPSYVLLVDEGHRILQANSAVREQLGLSPEEVVGKYCPKVVHGVDGPFHGCPLEEAVEKGQAVEREILERGIGTLDQIGDLSNSELHPRWQQNLPAHGFRHHRHQTE